MADSPLFAARDPAFATDGPAQALETRLAHALALATEQGGPALAPVIGALATALAILGAHKRVGGSFADIAHGDSILNLRKPLIVAATAGEPALRQAVAAAQDAFDAIARLSPPDRQPMPPTRARPAAATVSNIETPWLDMVSRADPSHAEKNRRDLGYPFRRSARGRSRRGAEQ